MRGQLGNHRGARTMGGVLIDRRRTPEPIGACRFARPVSPLTLRSPPAGRASRRARPRPSHGRVFGRGVIVRRRAAIPATSGSEPAPAARIRLRDQADLPCPVLPQKIILFPFFRNHALMPSSCFATRGASRSSRTLRQGGGGRDVSQRSLSARTNGMARTRSRVVPASRHPDADAKPEGHDDPEGDGGQKPVHRGEREVSVKTIAQGRPGRSG